MPTALLKGCGSRDGQVEQSSTDALEELLASIRRSRWHAP
jgi:hypothetical protein